MNHRWEITDWAPYKGVRPEMVLRDLDMGVGGDYASITASNCNTSSNTSSKSKFARRSEASCRIFPPKSHYKNDPVQVHKILRMISSKLNGPSVASGKQQFFGADGMIDVATLQRGLGELEEHLKALTYLCKHPDKYAISFGLQCTDQWRSSSGYNGRFGGRDEEQVHFPAYLSLHLLHPGVIFEELSQASHAIILASGTLTPVDSFFSELGEDFASR